MTTSSPPSAASGGFIDAFTSLVRLPRAFWIVVGAFVVESIAYFGILTLMTTYLSADLGWSDQWSGVTVSLFTMLVTLFMLGIGSYAESFGLRRAILCALLVSTVGRVLYSGAGNLADGTLVAIAIVGSLAVVASGSGILQPVCYSGVKQYTDARTHSMGYGLIYALMNLGVVAAGSISAWIRPAVQKVIDGQADSGPQPFVDLLARLTGSGVQAVNWVCTGITALTFIAFLLLMSRRAESAKLRPDRAEELRKADRRPLAERVKGYFAEGPFTNPRFIFFIFMLLPVRTLFAHQWLTMPQYILRAYPQGIADRMEWLVNWINPIVIFVGVPLATALTRHVSVYRMMVIGSLVSAAPTFLLCFGPHLGLLLTYFVVFSIGEALWSARFLEYASELAPEGRIAQYMGLANVPWLLAKGTTGFYSGYMLATYVPAATPPAELETGTLWFIYGCIAMLSPIGLWLARHWVLAGLQPQNPLVHPSSNGDNSRLK
jgi:MFS family permease